MRVLRGKWSGTSAGAPDRDGAWFPPPHGGAHREPRRNRGAVTGAALEGDLRQFFTAEVLQFLVLAEATGRIEFERPGEHVEVSLDRGRPTFAHTSRGSARTGEILVHRGVISAEALERALEIQRHRHGERLGSLLVATESVSRDQVVRAVEETMRRILFGVMLWSEGRFRFFPGARIAEDEIHPELALDQMILEGLGSADERRS